MSLSLLRTPEIPVLITSRRSRLLCYHDLLCIPTCTTVTLSLQTGSDVWDISWNQNSFRVSESSCTYAGIRARSAIHTGLSTIVLEKLTRRKSMTGAKKTPLKFQNAQQWLALYCWRSQNQTWWESLRSYGIGCPYSLLQRPPTWPQSWPHDSHCVRLRIFGAY